MYTEMLLRRYCVEESETAFIDLLMSDFLTKTRKNFEGAWESFIQILW